MNVKKKEDGLKVILERDDVLDLKNLRANRLSMDMGYLIIW